MQTKKHLSFAIRHGGPHKARRQFSKAVSIRWTGLGTGLWDWTVGLDSQKVALILSSD